MTNVEDALSLVLSHTEALPPAKAAVANSLDLMLAEPIASDIDSPPHDKSVVDGYAVVAESIANAHDELVVLEQITAGQVPREKVVAGTASSIMTGAPIPNGADAVVMIEKTELNDGRVRILQPLLLKPGQNIMRKASSMARDDVVLEVGKRVGPIEIGLLSEVGRSEVLAIPRPRVAILATGNELVAPDQVPSAGQIRNSNGPLMAALVRRAGGEPVELGIGRDDPSDLRRLCERGLACDVLVISGGVSAGVLDLVPSVLTELGVREVFHKINLKPGKPLWFGVKVSPVAEFARIPEHQTKTLVFGLPGNPVSTLVCFELFVRPALAKLAGRTDELRTQSAKLGADYSQRGDRVTMVPAALRREGDDLIATPITYRGSGDLRALSNADGLIRFEVGERVYGAGEEVRVWVMS